MRRLVSDIRSSIRSLLKSPGFTSGVILILGLGIGANTAIFSLVNAFLLRPLPFDEPDQLVHVWQNNSIRGWGEQRISVPDFLDYRQQTTTLEALGGYYYSSANIITDEAPVQVGIGYLTDNLFDLLGVAPALGRGFSTTEGTTGRNQVVVLSHRYWQRHLHGATDVTGRMITMDGVEHTIVGVMPETFEFPLKGTMLWKPLVLDAEDHDRAESGPLLVVGRMKENATMDQVQSDLNTIAARLEDAYPEANTGVGTDVVPLRKAMVFFYDLLRQMFLMLLLATGFVTLIVCANVGNLLLVRSMNRSHEVAIRSALGAGRWSIVRHLFTESVCLALVGGALGIVLAHWAVSFIGPAIPEDIYRAGAIDIDARTLAFTMGTSLLVAVLFGLVPSIVSSRTDLNQTLRAGGRGASGHVRTRKLHGLLVVSEISLAMILVVSSILMVRTFVNMQDVQPGFNPDQVLTAEMRLPRADYADMASWNTFYDEALSRIEALPQVTSAAAVYPLPMNFESFGIGFVPEGRPFRGPEDELSANRFWVTPDFFRTLDIPVLAGRALNDLDLPEGDPVVVINQTMARRHWPDEDPLGRRLRLAPGDDDERFVTVVGVVRDMKHFLMTDGPTDLVFFPQSQSPRNRRFLLVKTDGDPLMQVDPVRSQINALDPNLPLTTIRSMRQVVAETLNMWGGAASGFGALGVGALLLSAIGLYSLVAYSVNQRIQELGIRIALGAESKDIIGLVMREGLWLTGIGITLGLVGAIILSRFLSTLLFDVSPNDPLTFIMTGGLLASAALLACYLPSRRATRIDPMVALRSE